MVVHQNITNLAGYFHFLNVRKIPYVIRLKALSWLLVSATFGSRFITCLFWGRLRGGRQMAGGGGRLGLWKGFLSPCGRGGFFAALYLGRLRGGRRGKGLAFEERFLIACGRGGFFAALYLGRLRGGRQMGAC